MGSSRESGMSNNPKSRPSLSKFHQQQLPACTPVITVRNAYPFCLFIGVLFIALGAWFLSLSQSIQEISIPYTHCYSTADQTKTCSELIKGEMFQSQNYACNCKVPFNLQSDMKGPLYIYYGLTNFYQNHRRYVRSRDDNQLNGQSQTIPIQDCEPYRFLNISGTLKPIAPCGAIAMSIFNDTFSITSSDGTEVKWSRKNISWPSDRTVKFGKVTSEMLKDTVKPPSWKLGPLARNPDSYSGDEDLIVWMRTAALPNFRKLYARIDSTDGLKTGAYNLSIQYDYPVTQFDGTKRVIITQSSWMGGKNDALGIAYIVVGIIHLLLGGVFLVIDCHLVKRRHRNGR